jgi:hypothetical protein
MPIFPLGKLIRMVHPIEMKLIKKRVWKIFWLVEEGTTSPILLHLRNLIAMCQHSSDTPQRYPFFAL